MHASQVGRVHTAAIQVLCAFVLARRQAGHATVFDDATDTFRDAARLLAAGIKPSRPLRELQAEGVVTGPETAGDAERPTALIDLVDQVQPTEYWVGYDNFYVITRYNRSTFYAMSVFQLAEALRAGQAQ